MIKNTANANLAIHDIQEFVSVNFRDVTAVNTRVCYLYMKEIEHGLG